MDSSATPSGPCGLEPEHEPPVGTHVDQLSDDDRLLGVRVHRSVDLLRFLTGVLAIAIVLAVSWLAHATISGAEQDISHGTNHAPGFLMTSVGLIAGMAVLITPVAFTVERLAKQAGLRVAHGVLAAVLAHGVSLATTCG